MSHSVFTWDDLNAKLKHWKCLVKLSPQVVAGGGKGSPSRLPPAKRPRLEKSFAQGCLLQRFFSPSCGVPLQCRSW